MRRGKVGKKIRSVTQDSQTHYENNPTDPQSVFWSLGEQSTRVISPSLLCPRYSKYIFLMCEIIKAAWQTLETLQEPCSIIINNQQCDMHCKVNKIRVMFCCTKKLLCVYICGRKIQSHLIWITNDRCLVTPSPHCAFSTN